MILIFALSLEMKKKPFCLMPFLHFHVGDRGDVRACCVGNIPYGNVNNNTKEEIWNGEAINALREKFLEGESDNRCKVCLDLEKNGAKSIREETFERFPDYKVSEHEGPIYFDVRFSNVCNFRCRTCWHGASSKWFNDAKTLGTAIGNKAIIGNLHDFDKFIQEYGSDLIRAEEIYFAGGEPLVTEEHYQLLNWLIERKSTDMRLRYNTNFSILHFKNYNVLKLWESFPSVEVMASIDAMGVEGEYIRKEFSWEGFVQNVKEIKDYSHINFKVAPTISVYNVKLLPDFYKYLIEQEVIEKEDFYVNILHRPDYFNIQILPKEKKEAVNKLYSQFLKENFPTSILKKFKEIVTYMNARDRSHLWKVFQKKSSELDELRGESSHAINY